MKFKYWHQKTFSLFIQSEKNFQYGHDHLHKKITNENKREKHIYGRLVLN